MMFFNTRQKSFTVCPKSALGGGKYLKFRVKAGLYELEHTIRDINSLSLSYLLSFSQPLYLSLFFSALLDTQYGTLSSSWKRYTPCPAVTYLSCILVGLKHRIPRVYYNKARTLF